MPRLGFSVEDLLRESLSTLKSKMLWMVRFCCWLFEWFSTPQGDNYLFWLDESFVYLAESGGKSVTYKQPSGEYRRAEEKAQKFK